MQNKSINRFVLGGTNFHLFEKCQRERLLKVLNITNFKFWYCLGFRASDLGFSLWGVLGRKTLLRTS